MRSYEDNVSNVESRAEVVEFVGREVVVFEDAKDGRGAKGVSKRGNRDMSLDPSDDDMMGEWNWSICRPTCR